LILILALVLAQSQPVNVTDPTTPTRKAKVTPTAGGALQVECVGGTCSGGGGGGSSGGGVIDGGTVGASQSGPWSVTTDIRDAGIVQQQLADVQAQLALIKAKTDNLDVLLSTRTKPADSQTITGSVGLSGTADVSDRAARLLGKADLLIAAAAPSVSNYMPARLSDGAAYYKAAIAGDNMGRTWNLSSGADSVSALGPVTDTQLRASPVPVSGTVNQGASSDGGVPWPVDWSGSLNDGGRVASEGGVQSLLEELQRHRALQQQMVELLQQTVEYVSKLKEPGR
jgi:hypothetical protein